MDITFLIGNGFDLAYGLKSSYSDFYSHYTFSKPLQDFCLNKFKKDISEDLKTWADAELALGAYTGKFNKENFSDFKSVAMIFVLV